MIKLRVWANARPMGWFGHAAAEFFFQYDDQWLQQPGGYVLAPQFPLADAQYRGALVKSFFENLLPEGQALEDVVASIQIRDASAFELLGHLGKELPGVLSLLAPEAKPTPVQEYGPLTYEALSLQIRDRINTPLLVSNVQTTMSLAGAQEKKGLRFDPDKGTFSESMGSSPTTHILKPDTRQLRYQPSAVNEYACMKLAKAIKLNVPEVWFLRVPEPVYIVQRYDRELRAGNTVGIHQFDGCQLLGHGAGWKYERMGGLVSLAKIVKALRRLNVKGADLLKFQQWVMFNYLIGNADAHAKNISVLVDDRGYRLAPFYDLLCVSAYGDTGLAMYIGDEESFQAVGRHSWEGFCQDCEFRIPETLMGLRKMAQALPAAWDKVLARIQKYVQPTESEQALLNRIEIEIRNHCSAALSMTE